jgi:hypothetical protein
MFDSSFGSSKFHKLLFRFDQDIASKTRADRCPYCGGKLHVANYLRHPRGIHGTEHEQANLRFSFCCGREGCRRRVTPPSVRFLGRKVYSGATVVLVTAMRCRDTKQAVNRIKALFGVGNKTLQRWRIWWQEYFPKTIFWTIAKGYFSEPIQETSLPASLLDRFQGANLESRLFATLRFLTMLSASYFKINHRGVSPRRT